MTLEKGDAVWRMLANNSVVPPRLFKSLCSAKNRIWGWASRRAYKQCWQLCHSLWYSGRPQISHNHRARAHTHTHKHTHTSMVENPAIKGWIVILPVWRTPLQGQRSHFTKCTCKFLQRSARQCSMLLRGWLQKPRFFTVTFVDCMQIKCMVWIVGHALTYFRNGRFPNFMQVRNSIDTGMLFFQLSI